MIEDVTQYVLGICIGCILYLIYEVFSLYKKIERINIDINKLQIKDIEFHRNIEFIINDSEYNKEVLEHFIDKLSKTFRDKYTDKHYIKDNWFTDKFIINDITADTIAKGIGQYITNTDSDRYSVSAIMWLSDIKDYIDALLKYGDFDFVAKAFKIYNITDTRFELIRKLYHYFYD